MRHEIEKWILFIINCFMILLWFILIVFPIFFLEELRQHSFQLPLDFILKCIMLYVSILCIRYPLAQLKKILYNLSNRELFTPENISRFKKIAYPLFIFALISSIMPTGSLQVTVIFLTIKSDTFVYLIMGLASLLMSYILDEARIIQLESEQLKEETRLTI